MGSFFDLLVVPGALLGALAGLVLAGLFHWLAPAGSDTVAAGAWFVGLGWLLGLCWSKLSGAPEK